MGSAPVPLESYLAAVAEQSLQQSTLDVNKLRATFRELRLNATLLSQLGQAINDGRGLFLYGPPGNGKTSLSELVVSAYGEFIWIPRTITIDGELVRLFDPRSHEAVATPQLEEYPLRSAVDSHSPADDCGRWRVDDEPARPAVQPRHRHQRSLGPDARQRRGAGDRRLRPATDADVGTTQSPDRADGEESRLSESLQRPAGLRAVRHAAGVLDQPRTERPGGRSVSAAHSLQDRSERPKREEFVTLFQELAAKADCQCDLATIHYLLDTHYQPVNRPLRFCHPRDLLRQVRNYCEFHKQELAATSETLDIAVRNYFAGL